MRLAFLLLGRVEWGMVAVIMCGLQGAGKSRFALARFGETHVRLNLDMLGTRNRETILLHACLAAQASFVVDNTNLTAEQRGRYVALARAAGFGVECYYMDTPLNVCVERNGGRSGDACVPEKAIYGAAAKWQKPTKEEGFDRLFVVKAEGGEFVVEEVVEGVS